MTAPAENDDSVLEQLGDVVDVVLAEDIAPAPEDASERRQRLLDSWTAIISAVAAVETAWASFPASQWSGPNRTTNRQARWLDLMQVEPPRKPLLPRLSILRCG
jgi:hypothetical protein